MNDVRPICNLLKQFTFSIRTSSSLSRSPDRIPASYLCYLHVANATGCHAGCQEVSRCLTRGESEESIACRWQSMQARDPSWLWNPGETSPEVQNRGISGPTDGPHYLCSKKFLKKWKKVESICLKSSRDIMERQFLNMNNSGGTLNISGSSIHFYLY